jgi:nucleotide-binding universal stress UspA family protein
MDEAFVVFDSDETGVELLEEAGELAAGVDAHLTILSLMTPEEFSDVRATLDVVGEEEHTSYDDKVVLDVAKRQASERAEELFEDSDVDWDIVATRVGDRDDEADVILSSADDYDADHVFISGQQRSPTGKAVFGDRTQSIILNFDGPVTTLLD